jgi:hypothetical protein
MDCWEWLTWTAAKEKDVSVDFEDIGVSVFAGDSALSALSRSIREELPNDELNDEPTDHALGLLPPGLVGLAGS